MGDIGEIWFGEESQERMVKWLETNEMVSFQDPVLDMGCGNGAFLLELRMRGFTCLTGVDYAQGAVDLALAVLDEKGYTDVELQAGDLTSDPTSLLATSCLCRQYRVCVDKGTYDAISLNPDGAERSRMAYRQMVKHLLQPGGLLMITSCNWTKDELLDFFKTDFKLYGEIKAPSYQFGGKVGQCVTTLIFTTL
ncbi:EEF1A lysine methyltransferase 2-like isoform X2 [Pomacea canaliculata]|nr:EEF1A lysine methyltransferase 2-like isoform X2 [Pomacea canaliculata]